MKIVKRLPSKITSVLRLKKFDQYIIKNFLGTYAFAILLLMVIVIIFDANEKLDAVLTAPLYDTVFKYFLNFLPFIISQFSPLFTFIAVIFFTSRLADRSEIIAILSSGITFRRLTVPYLACAALIANAADIAVVAPASGFGQNLGRHLVRWLGMNGIAADFVDDRTVSTGLRGKRLAYLVMPKDAHFAALSAFASRGGRMFAFYSDSPKVAALFGVKMGAYKKADGTGTFSKIVFGKTAPPGSPSAIVQTASRVASRRSPS